MKSGILTDVTRCVGCQKCVKACQQENKCLSESPDQKSRPEELFNTRWTSIIRRPQQHFVRRQCRHCLDPACVSVCPVGAMIKTDTGPVVYDKSKCIGCRYCIPRYEWESLAPGVAKCTMCAHRLKDGKQPACTEACPEKATIFGKRDELLKEAKKRIKKYGNLYLSRVFGETEVGGASVLYVSDVDLSFLGFKKDLGSKSLPGVSWQALRQTPLIAGTVVAVMTGLEWIIGRRIKLQAEKKKGKA